MSFLDLDIKWAYDTGVDDPLHDFYIPALTETGKYDRIAGFFSSSSLAIAARGICGLIENQGHMRILACPQLSADDKNIILETLENPDEYLDDVLLRDLEKLEDEFENDHLEALGWMLANGYLEIKLAILHDPIKNAENFDALFHQKVGILTDVDGNSLSFSGSLNETAFGWLENIEEFKVFKEWESGQEQYYRSDRKKFDEYWNNLRPGVKVVDLPTAVQNKLIQIGSSFSKDKLSLDRYVEKQHTRVHKDPDILSTLFSYQTEALATWKNNDYKLLFEMATGTGKTRTALACVSELLKKEKQLICVIATPQATLSMQWRTELNKLHLKFDDELIADGSHTWKNVLERKINQISTGLINSLVIYTTHKTVSSVDFTSQMGGIFDIPICFVGDEAHGLGATKAKDALLENYRYRIGLSATPSRWYDDYGTELLQEYFGNKSYQFTLLNALQTINPLTNKPFLVKYYYHPIFIHLNDDEIEEYIELSDEIGKLAIYCNQKSDKYRDRYERLLFKRSKIIKRAQDKLSKFSKLIDELLKESDGISDTLVFADDAMVEPVLQILKDRQILAHKFTQDESTKPDPRKGGKSERDEIIELFKEKIFKAIVAIKCMDEGIDIPCASTEIIMASSTNPREYIQRLGRVLRQDEGKDHATIDDFIIVPDPKKLRYPDLIAFEEAIFEREMIRVKTMSEGAINNAEILIEIDQMLKRR